MCGGAGTWLWPASRDNRPKQFLPLFGALSTFQGTVRRVTDPALFARPIVVTNGQYRFLVAVHPCPCCRRGGSDRHVRRRVRRGPRPSTAISASVLRSVPAFFAIGTFVENPIARPPRDTWPKAWAKPSSRSRWAPRGSRQFPGATSSSRTSRSLCGCGTPAGRARPGGAHRPFGEAAGGRAVCLERGGPGAAGLLPPDPGGRLVKAALMEGSTSPA